MSPLLEQLIREHGEEAAKALPAAASVVLERFAPVPVETESDPSGHPVPSLATRLGRLAGKWFPSEKD